MKKLGITLLATLAACSKSPAADTENQDPTVSAYVDTQAGRYQVDVDPSIDPKLMPKNADLKMLDGDLERYALKLCGLDFANTMRPDRCDVFVQPDKEGLLVGYATLLQGKDVQIDTAIETNPQRSGIGCFLKGKLENDDYEKSDSKIDISQNFSGRMAYFAWEKSAGDWVVSTDTESSEGEGAMGMWYVKKEKNNLRITQERWSYCYSDTNIYIDEVFKRAVSLTRVAD